MKEYTETSSHENLDFDRVTRCPYEEHCSGCSYLGMKYGEQTELKKSQLRGLLASSGLVPSKEIRVWSVGSERLRDRLDFSLQQGSFGLYDKERQVILDLEDCSQLSPALQDWLTEFRRIHWPIQRGSIRLRIGPHGQKGVWLDFSNIDIKAILDEKTILRTLQQVSTVEMGQRRKIPYWTGSEYKLRDPEFHIWFQTWLKDRPVDLYCQVASFTQPSLQANKRICDQIQEWIQAFPHSRVIEFGSGIGNLTLPALMAAQEVLACEMDGLSLQGLEKTLENLPPDLQILRTKLQIHRGDFQRKQTPNFSLFDGVLVNPPRSGLMGFLNSLEELSMEERPVFFIYMSCFPETMAQDLVRLSRCGYRLKEVCIVDQFPQTSHYEVLGFLEKGE